MEARKRGAHVSDSENRFAGVAPGIPVAIGNDYFSDGLSEELNRGSGKIPVSKSSAVVIVSVKGKSDDRPDDWPEAGSGEPC